VQQRSSPTALPARKRVSVEVMASTPMRRQRRLCNSQPLLQEGSCGLHRPGKERHPSRITKRHDRITGRRLMFPLKSATVSNNCKSRISKIAHRSNESTMITSTAQPTGSRSPAPTLAGASAARGLELSIRATAGRSRHRYPLPLMCALNQAGRWLHPGHREELGKIVVRSDLPVRSGRPVIPGARQPATKKIGEEHVAARRSACLTICRSCRE
jgi:hypothetical protein